MCRGKRGRAKLHPLMWAVTLDTVYDVRSVVGAELFATQGLHAQRGVCSVNASGAGSMVAERIRLGDVAANSEQVPVLIVGS
jgi:hypothetical protein